MFASKKIVAFVENELEEKMRRLVDALDRKEEVSNSEISEVLVKAGGRWRFFDTGGEATPICSRLVYHYLRQGGESFQYDKGLSPASSLSPGSTNSITSPETPNSPETRLTLPDASSPVIGSRPRVDSNELVDPARS